MGQDGTRSSFPDSFFEIDEFDTNWDEDGERSRPVPRDDEPASEVHLRRNAPTAPPSSLDDLTLPVEPPPLTLDLEAPPEGFPAERSRNSDFELALPLIHGANVPERRAFRGGSGEPSLGAAAGEARPNASAPTVRPGKPPTVLEADYEPDASEESSRPTFPDDPLLAEVRDRYAMGDYSGALVMAEGVLELDPQHELAQRYAGNCRQVLEQMYRSKLGALDHVPMMAVESDKLRWLSLDHRAGFLLSLVDGTSSVEEILDISGMPPIEALRIMCDLADQNVIALSRPRR